MKLSDVIHFYLGAEAEFDGRRGKITKVSIQNNKPLIRISWTSEYNRYIDAWASEIKLFLRPLSSMTEEEAAYLYRIIEPIPMFNDWKIVSRTEGYTEQGHEIHDSIICFRFDSYCGHPSVKDYLPQLLLQLDDEDCSITWGRFRDAGNELMDSIEDSQSDQFCYLISKGFDLWNLISTNQAIDITKLNKNEG